MCETIGKILSSVDFWKTTFPALIAIIVWWLNERSKRKWEKWNIKKDACLKALNLANAVLSNYEYQNLKKGDIEPQYTTIEEARSCFNELACTCDTSTVIEELKKIMFDSSVTPAAIVELRNAVRKELKFSDQVIDIDQDKAFVGKINCLENKSHNKRA
jgi:hypothetical protein